MNSCTSFLFLRDATLQSEALRLELFKMNEQQIALFESLQDREGLYMRRDGLTKVVTLNLDSRSYATFSTKPKDRIRRGKLIEKYGLSEGIARFCPKARQCNQIIPLLEASYETADDRSHYVSPIACLRDRPGSDNTRSTPFAAECPTLSHGL